MASIREKVGRFQIGHRVTVKGRRDEGRTFHAAKIEPNPDGNDCDELKGAVEWVNHERQTLGLMGLEVPDMPRPRPAPHSDQLTSLLSSGAIKPVVIALAIGLLLPLASFSVGIASAAGAIQQAQAVPTQTPPPTTPQCVIEGTVGSNGQPLAGVVIVAAADGRDVVASSSDVAGNYLVRVPSAGRYTVRAELAAFAAASRDAALTPDACAVRVDFTLTRPSRAMPTAPAAGAAVPPARPSAAPKAPRDAASKREAARGSAPGRGFQTLKVEPEATSAEAAGAVAEVLPEVERLDVPLPPGFSSEASTETVAMTGTQGQLNEALLSGDGGRPGSSGSGDVEGQLAESGFGQGGLGVRGPGAGLATVRRNNRLRGIGNYRRGGSMFDANPYPLNGARQTPEYIQQRYGTAFGGPVKIPRLFDGTGTTFFVNYLGNRSLNPVYNYSTVPTEAARAGDFSSVATVIVDPRTGLPFDGNRIPASRINGATRSLLSYIPSPNLPGDTLNFHHATAVTSSIDDVNMRFVHLFGAQPVRRGPRAGGAGAGAGSPAQGQRPGRQARASQGSGPARSRSTVDIGISYRRSTSVQSSSFPTIGGRTTVAAWNTPIVYSYSKGRLTNTLGVGFNRKRSESQNLYAFTRDVAGEAGILGVSRDPFDWGIPNLSFSSVTDLRDRNPSLRIDQRIEVSDTMVRPWGHHAFHWGGGFRDIRLGSRTDTEARGGFVFTGLYTSAFISGRPVPGTGLDFADFLLGLGQQGSVQYGPGRIGLRGRSSNLFVLDDWRARNNLTINVGLRYEYASPYVEKNGHLVDLDVAPGFTAAGPVIAGATGSFTGGFPLSLVRPDRNNVAPRIGIAWKPQPRTTIRAGYGVHYNLGAYGSIAQRMAGQPPFAVTAMSLGTPTVPLALTDAFARPDSATTTNSYGIDKNYRLGVIQAWNLDVQRDLAHNVTVGVGYTGTKGSNLDIQRAPNRSPTGLRIPGVQAFIWQSSEGHSILHSLTARAQKPLARGVSANASYTLSNGFDNASSIGGGTIVVAQNDLDLDAEWGRSSFDRRHTFSAESVVELPFGRGRRWLDRAGLVPVLLGDWAWNGTVAMQSGAPFTARVLGNFADVARGVNGTLRADYNGAAIGLDHPDASRFFNTGAFSVPPLGQFGNARRNTITGPGIFNVNMTLSKNVSFIRNRGLMIRLQAANVFNTVQFSAIDTVVNSPTFGRVVGVRPMRTVQLVTRLRF